MRVQPTVSRGRAVEPRPGIRSGHIPGSRNVPYNQLFDAATGAMKPLDDLRKAFSERRRQARCANRDKLRLRRFGRCLDARALSAGRRAVRALRRLMVGMGTGGRSADRDWSRLSDFSDFKASARAANCCVWPKGSAVRCAASLSCGTGALSCNAACPGLLLGAGLFAFSAARSAFLASALFGDGSSILIAGLSSFAILVAGLAVSCGAGAFACSGLVASVDAASGCATSDPAGSCRDVSELATSGLTESGGVGAASFFLGGVSLASLAATFVSWIVASGLLG